MISHKIDVDLLAILTAGSDRQLKRELKLYFSIQNCNARCSIVHYNVITLSSLPEWKMRTE